jgi:hypothetical protein
MALSMLDLLWLSPLYCIKLKLDFVIFIIIIRHELGPNRPVSASSNSLFKGLPSRLRPFGLYFSITLDILLFFIPVTCCGQFKTPAYELTFKTFFISSFLYNVIKIILKYVYYVMSVFIR